MKSVQLDVVFGESLETPETVQDAIKEMTEGTEITGRVVTDVGPAGGWPVVEFTGPESEIDHLAANHGYAVQ